MSNTPQIFITCLGAYNEGHLHGKWIDCIDIDDVNSEIQKLKETSPADYSEEFFITDYEGFEDYQVSEYEDLEQLCLIGQFLNDNQHNECTVKGFIWLLEDLGYDVSCALENAKDVCFYDGSLAEYAEELINDCYPLPDWALYYFDYEKFGRDLEMEGSVIEYEDNCLITNPQDF